MADHPEQERRFEALARSAYDLVTEVDAAGDVIYASPNHAAVMTGSPSEIDAGFRLDRVHPDDRESVAARFHEAWRSGESDRLAFRWLDRDDAVKWMACTVTPFEAEDGTQHALVVSRDITEVKQNEAELVSSRERFRLIVENAYDMIAEYGPGAELVYANGRVQEVLGFGADDVEDPAALVHPDDRERVGRSYASVIGENGSSDLVTYRVRRADDSWCWVDVNFRSFSCADGEPRLLAISRDVSARVEAESRVRESEQRYRELVENAPLGIVVVLNERIVFANPAATFICGAEDRAQLIGTHMFDLVLPEELRTLGAYVSRANARETLPDTLKLRLRGLDGIARQVIATGSRTTWEGERAFQAVLRDVTELERVHRAQEGLELQLQEARKLESLGVLAGGIAHDFNNLLAVILGNIRFGRNRDARSEDVAEALADAEEAASSAARLVHQLLDYAGRRSPEVKSVDLSEIVGSMSDLLGTAVPSGVELEFELVEHLDPVRADVVQLEQVVMNLVLNAAEAATDHGGRVVVRTWSEGLDVDELRGWSGSDDLAAGSYVCLEVLDSGVGMDAETQARIFDPFFTTKQTGHGLGLSAVLGLVRGHRGAIEVQSALGSGTRFRIALPADASRIVEVPDTGRPLVLVADADATFRGFAADLLRDMGYEPLEAGRAEQALDVVARHGSELDAALIDLSLDGANELIDSARASLPELPLLLTSGEPDPVCRTAGDPVPLLEKPYAERELREQLAALLPKD